MLLVHAYLPALHRLLYGGHYCGTGLYVCGSVFWAVPEIVLGVLAFSREFSNLNQKFNLKNTCNYFSQSRFVYYMLLFKFGRSMLFNYLNFVGLYVLCIIYIN